MQECLKSSVNGLKWHPSKFYVADIQNDIRCRVVGKLGFDFAKTVTINLPLSVLTGAFYYLLLACGSCCVHFNRRPSSKISNYHEGD